MQSKRALYFGTVSHQTMFLVSSFTQWARARTTGIYTYITTWISRVFNFIFLSKSFLVIDVILFCSSCLLLDAILFYFIVFFSIKKGVSFWKKIFCKKEIFINKMHIFLFGLLLMSGFFERKEVPRGFCLETVGCRRLEQRTCSSIFLDKIFLGKKGTKSSKLS